MNTNQLRRLIKRRNPRRKNQPRRQLRRRKQVVDPNRSLRMTTPGRFAPDKTRCILTWQDTTGLRGPTGSSQSLNWRMRSSVYDPDPSLLTGSIPGFAELANLYMEYCVHGMTLDLEIANPNTENLIIASWPSNTDINNNSLSKDDIAEFSGNVRAKSQIIGAVSGVNICHMVVNATGLQLVGNRFKTDLDYSASTSTTPVSMYYINVGAYCPQGNITYALIVKARVYYDVEFFKLRQLES